MSDSVAHGDSMSPTNKGVLDSNVAGIHGQRDPGVSHPGSGTQDGVSYQGGNNMGGRGDNPLSTIAGTSHNTGSNTASDLTGSNTSGFSGSGNTAGPQFTGTKDRDAGLIGSGVDSKHHHHGTHSNTRDPTGLSGSGSGYDSNNRDAGLTGSGTGSGISSSEYGSAAGGAGLVGAGSGLGSGAREPELGGTGTGSGLRSHTHEPGLAGSGAGRTPHDTHLGESNTGLGSGYDSGLTGSSGVGGTGSGLTGNRSEYDSTNTAAGSGLGGSGVGSGMGSGTSASGGQGLVGKAEQYVEGSEQHHRGDGHPEDIVHPGPHVTGTAKALDPHLN